MKLQRDYDVEFDDLPEEMILAIFQQLPCQVDTDESVRMVNSRWRRIRTDPRSCTCNVDELLYRILLKGDRRAIQHISRGYRDSIGRKLVGEMSLAVGDTNIPGVEGRCMPATPSAAQDMLHLACAEGRESLVRRLLAQGVTPNTAAVFTACERLEHFNDEGPLKALLEGGAMVEDAGGDLIDAAASCDEEEEGAPESAIAEILSSQCLAQHLRTKKLTTAFVYLLRWDARFAASRSNYLMALECAISTRSHGAARDLFTECGLDPKWLTGTHAALLVQVNWHELLEMVLEERPLLAREALDRAILSNAAECVAVAAKRTRLDEFSALSSAQLAARRDGTDEAFRALVVNSEGISRYLALNMLLEAAWVRRWVRSLEALLYMALDRGETPRILGRHSDLLVKWALQRNADQLLVPLLQMKRILLSPYTVMMLARHVRKHASENRAVDAQITTALADRPELFRQLMRD